MIALSVVAIGLMATIKAVNQEIRVANVAQNKLLALWLWQNKASEIRLNPNLPNIGFTQGKQNNYQQQWQWQLNTKNTANPKILKVELSIIKSTHNETDPLLKQSIYLGNFQ
jgi:type II secretion system protein I